MTVGELIQLLHNYSPDMQVIVYEPGDHSVGIWDYHSEIETVRQTMDIADNGKHQRENLPPEFQADDSVISWNDYVAKNKAEVIALLEEAIASLDCAQESEK